MDFFEQQQSARRRTRYLRLLFTLFAIVGVVPLGFVFALLASMIPIDAVNGRMRDFWRAMFRTGMDLFDWWIVVLFLILASLFMAFCVWQSVASARNSDKFARKLGGKKVSKKELGQRKLWNVVDEMAIAAGIPTPEVYVVPKSHAINALSAGHTEADAAILVTRGAIDALRREELQALVAHELSHIVSGDMALNVRLYAYLTVFSIAPVVGLLLFGFIFSKGAKDLRLWLLWLALLPISLPLAVIGGVHVIASFLLSACLGRQRELLADASALQLTRNPVGIKRALLKVAAQERVGELKTKHMTFAGHMCFASLRPGSAIDTHPPVIKRLCAVDPDCGPAEIDSFVESERQRAEAALELEASPDAEARADEAAPAVEDDPASTIESPKEGRDILFALLLDTDESVRRKQLAIIEKHLGQPAAQGAEAQIDFVRSLELPQRLPMLDQALPRLRELDRSGARRLLSAVREIVVVDGRVGVFEFALARTTAVFIRDLLSPAEPHGNRTLGDVVTELRIVMSVLAQHGHKAVPDMRNAYEIGTHRLLPRERPPFEMQSPWPARLEGALKVLDKLQPVAKELLIDAMLATVRHDERVTVNESELVRAIARTLHCPIPPFSEEIL